MIKKTDLLSLGYYGRGIFTGSSGSLRYRIEKYEGDEAETEAAPRFLVTTWYGPYAFDATSDDEKIQHFEDFSDEGLECIAKYLTSLEIK
ncbi:MAG: hypothetical protein K6F00_02975 [Lachnospiraceae bacterium]|nr:hypothetical protein [Lachnospiraceae bacterium]